MKPALAFFLVYVALYLLDLADKLEVSGYAEYMAEVARANHKLLIQVTK